MSANTRSSIPSIYQRPLPELAILLVATVARFWRLGYHSIWFDEAVSLKWAGAFPFKTDLAYMIPLTFRLVEEKHPPVYYTLLTLWREGLTLFGWDQSDVALRSLGVLLGIATVLGMLLLVEQLCGRPTALVAGVLIALSPVLIWYSQELRMFQPAVTFIVWALLCMARAWRSAVRWRRWLWWAGALLSFELALYGYLFSAFVLPAAGLTLLLWLAWDGWGRRAWGRFFEGATTLLVTGLLFLPLARNAWLVNGNESTPGEPFANFWQNSQRHFKIFTIWREKWPSPIDSITFYFLLLLFVLGLLLPLILKGMVGKSSAKDRSKERETRRTGGWLAGWQSGLLLLLWVGFPFLLGNLLLVSSNAVFKEDRYHIYLAPFVLWAIGLGVVSLAELGQTRGWRAVGWLAGSLATLALLLTLPRFWTPALLREDWRAAASYIDAYQQQSPSLPSASVAHINYTHLPMDWYLRRYYPFDDLPVFGLFGDPLTPNMVESMVAPPLMGIVDFGSHTLWLTQSHLDGVDDGRVVEGWLRETFPVVTEQYPTGVKMTGFALRSVYAEVPSLGPNANFPKVALAPGLILAACEVVTPQVRAQDERLHPPSGWVHLRLWWRVTGEIPTDYVATARVVDAQGVWGERLPREGETTTYFPTSRWQIGDIVRDEFDVNLNPITPAGEYSVMIGAGMMGAGGPLTDVEALCGNLQIVK